MRTHQMKISCSDDGRICNNEGRRQLQFDSIENVPSVTPAAIMAPAYQDSLNNPVMTPRSRGYVSSAISCEAPLMAKGMPKPSKMRDTTNMETAAISYTLLKKAGDA